MWFPEVRYVQVDEKYLELHSFDGTCRGVVFRSEDAARLARLPGRAECDVIAIEHGFLPHGSYLVSRAGHASERSGEGRKVDVSDPLARALQRFAAERVIKRSEYITEERDSETRAREPDAASRYDNLVSEIIAASEKP